MPHSPSATENSAPSPSPDERSTTAKKTAATVLRHKQERRAESLAHIRSQTDEGSLASATCPTRSSAAASQAARTTRTRNEARTRRYRSPTTGRRRTAGRLQQRPCVPEALARSTVKAPALQCAVGSSSAGRAAAGVRLKRGAGPGWRVPPTSTNVPRAVMWGCSGASQTPRTTVAHASSPSSSPPHSPAVRAAKTSVRRCLNSGQRSRSNCGICSAGTPSSSSRRA